MPSIEGKTAASAFKVAFACCGWVVYYAVQGKSYPCQRYPFTAFLLLALAVILTSAMQEGKTWQRWIAVGALGAAILVTGSFAAKRALAYRATEDQFGALLSDDLRVLGVDRLRGNVQCLDTFSGCIRVLNDMRIRQSTGTLYDEFLFGPSNAPGIASSRAAFTEEIAVRPPDAIIMTPQFYSDGSDTYNKILSWPDFARYLSENYNLYVERTPYQKEFWEGSPRVPSGYRIYLRKRR